MLRFFPIVLYFILVTGFALAYTRLAFALPEPAKFLSDPWIGLSSLWLVLIVIALERLLPYRKDWNVLRVNERNDWLHLVFALLPSEVVGRSLALMAVLALRDFLPVFQNLPWPTDWPFALQVLLGMVIFDFLYYWYHRAMHTVPWLWPIHRLHHTPENLTVTKGFRHTFAEWGVDVFLHTLVLTLCGVPTAVFVWIMAITLPITLLSHANLALPPARPLEWLLNVPTVHRVHHHQDLRTGNSNYSAFFMLWDHVFGTYSDPALHPPEKLGIARPLPERFVAQWLSFLWEPREPRDETGAAPAREPRLTARRGPI